MIRAHDSIPTSEIRLLIFDLDGTLVDSQLDLANAVNAMLVECGRPELPVDLIASYIGDGAPMLVRRALGDPKDEHYLQSALHSFMSHYRAHKLDNTFAYPGVAEMLERVTQSAGDRIKMAVLTNKPVNPSRGILEGLGLSKYFVQIYGGNSFETKKPDPLGALALLKETNTLPEHAIMIGDSQTDVLTARNTGMWSIGVTYGFSPESLTKHPPDVLVDEVPEIAQALGLEAAAPLSGDLPSTEGFV